MIIWINGAYGVGKSTVARAIGKRKPDTFLLDAEKVGDAIRDNLPKQFWLDEYPDYELWRKTVAELLVKLGTEYAGDVVVPMTVLRQAYLDEIFAALSSRGIKAEQIILTAAPELIRERIHQRGEDDGCWCMNQIKRCETAVQSDLTGICIPSDGKTPDDLASAILESCESGNFPS